MASGKSYNGRIEALRGLAALTVAAFHAGQTPMAPETYPAMLAFGGDDGNPVLSTLAAAYRLLLNGHGAVLLFFVISGHVLRVSLDRSAQTDSHIGLPFLARRAIRLFPPVAFMALVFAFFFYTMGLAMPGVPAESYTLPKLLLDTSMLRDWGINPVLWSLRIEVIAAPVILLLWLAARRWGPGVLWGALVALLALSFANKFDRWAMAEFQTPWQLFLLLYAFVAGMLVTEWCAILARLPVRRFGGLYVLACCLLLMAGWTFASGNYRQIVEVLGSVGMVAGLWMGFSGPVSRLLDTAFARFYGRISYSFYLLHPLTLMVLWVDRPFIDRLSAAHVPGFVLAFIAFVVTTIVVTPLAMLSYALVEAPTIRLARRLRRNTAAPAPHVDTNRMVSAEAE